MPKPRTTSCSAPLAAGSREGQTIATLLAAAGLVGAVCILYGRATNSPFIFDDEASVSQNASIERLWPLWGDAEHPGPLNPPKETTTSGRPLVNLSLAMNYQFGRFDPVGYHVFNLIVHALSAIFLFVIVRRTLWLEYFGGRFNPTGGMLAFAVALLWAVHPLQTETVVYVTQRTELLVGFFYLATIYGGLRYWGADSPRGHRTWLVLTTLACLAGMACKEVMVTAPVIVLLFERTFIAGSFLEALRKSWPLYVGLALGWGLLLLVNLGAPRSESSGFHLGVSAIDWWFTQAKVLWMYLGLSVWPWPLSIHYEMPYLTTFAAVWPWAISAAVLGVGTLVLLWRRNLIGFVGAWVLIILSPTLVVPIITEVVAERRMYLPLAALVTLAVVGGFALAQYVVGERRGGAAGREAGSVSGWPMTVTAAAALILAVVFSLVSVRRLEAYHDAATLWQDAVTNQPDDYRAHYNLANVLRDSGRWGDAIEHYRDSLRIKPDYVDALTNLGIALSTAGQKQEAIQCFEQALRLAPEHAEAHNNFGLALASSNRWQEAIEQYQRALQLRPRYAEAHLNLGGALLAVGRTQEAVEQFEQALQIKPDYAEAYYNLGNCLGMSGRLAEAVEYFRRAVQIKPGYAQAQNNLGVALFNTGQAPEAIEHYLRAVALKPDYAEAQDNLGNALVKAGRAREAIVRFQQAVQLRSDFTKAHLDLATAYTALNEAGAADAAARKALELARAQGQTALAEQIETWLTNNRANKK